MSVFPAPPTWSQDLLSIGVTGTNGKTSTVAFLAAILNDFAPPAASVTTLGMFVGGAPLDVPKTYDGMLEALTRCRAARGRFAVLEVTSEVLARGFAQAWPFRAAVFTNFTHDHLDAHGSLDHYFASKAQLFATLPSNGGIAVLNGYDDVSHPLHDLLPIGVREIRYGVPSRARAEPGRRLDLHASGAEITWEGTRARVETSSTLGIPPFVLTTRAVGEIFLENALAALAMALALGVPLKPALRALASTPPPPGRFEKVAERPVVVVDYAHTPDGLERTLATARLLTRDKLWVVFGAGGERDREKRPHMGAAAGLADRVLVTSDNPRSEDPAVIVEAVRAGVPRTVSCEVELDRERAILRAVLEAGEDDLVVIAGKGHETVQSLTGAQRPFSDVAVAQRAIRQRAVGRVCARGG